MKIDQHTIFEIHRLNDLSWSQRKIARHLRIGRPAVKKYLNNPDQTPTKRKKRTSKLDAYRDLIKQFTLWLHKKCNILKEKTCGAP